MIQISCFCNANKCRKAIEQIGENGLRITLAVAGFSMEMLDVEVEQAQLTIRGRQLEEPEKVYLHRGIAGRQFQRSFVLADGIEVRGAHLDNGLLHIELERVLPQSTARKIEIKNGGFGHDSSQVLDLDPNAGALQIGRK